jgi:predicted nucleotidyltransferase component of viral defense system
MKRQITNIPASVRRRLLDLARERKEEFNFILTRFAAERLLYRLSTSTHSKDFVLKGAMLFLLWNQHGHRPTRDIDLLGFGEHSIPRLEEVFRTVCGIHCPSDGLDFVPESVQGDLIKEGEEYEGVRIVAAALLGVARISLQIDIGFGDAVTPDPEEVIFPVLLQSENLPAPRLTVYPKETVVAEKLETIVRRGLSNSRMKDYYDLWVLTDQFQFSQAVLVEAVRRTFNRRATVLTEGIPAGLSKEFSSDAVKIAQWSAFIRKVGAGNIPPPLSDVIGRLHDLLGPVLETVRNMT